MDASEIKDSETLLAWLETRPQTDSVIIAYRSALRATAELYTCAGFRPSQRFDVTSLCTMRCVLTSGAAR